LLQTACFLHRKRAVFLSAFKHRQDAEIALDLFFDLVTDAPRAFKLFVGRAAQGGRIRKTHVKPFRFVGEHRAPFRARLIAHRHCVVECLPARQNVGDRLLLAAGDINADVNHRLRDNRIEFPLLNARTLRFILIAATHALSSFLRLTIALLVYHRMFTME